MATATSTRSATDTKTEEPPTIIHVQGSFQIPEVYKKLVDGLVAKGYPTIHPTLPSCSDIDSPEFPQRTLIDDALKIRSELIRQIEYGGKTVIVVMHSYGGLVGSEAIPEELSYSKRQGQGLPGGVIHLYFYTAFLLEEGQSVISAFGESPNTDVRPDGRVYLLNAEKTLYNDLPPAEASFWASKVIPQPYKVQTTKLTRAAWRYIPSTYLVCENDQIVPPQVQETFAAKAKAQVEKCTSGHSPQLSQPEVLVAKIDEVAKKVEAGTCT